MVSLLAVAGLAACGPMALMDNPRGALRHNARTTIDLDGPNVHASVGASLGGRDVSDALI